MKIRDISALLFVGSMGSLLSCDNQSGVPSDRAPQSVDDVGSEPASETCPSEQDAPSLLPGVTAEHGNLDYWLQLLSQNYDVDEVLLSASDVHNLNRSFEVLRDGFHSQQNLLLPVDFDEFQSDLRQRFEWMTKKVIDGEYRRDGDNAFATPIPELSAFSSEFRVALEEIQIYCVPTTEGFYDAETTNDRINRNHCSNVHGQELIEFLAPWSGGMTLVRTATSWGFVAEGVSLSPKLTSEMVEKFSNGPFAVMHTELQSESKAGSVTLLPHTRIPYVDSSNERGYVATTTGVETLPLKSGQHQPTTQPLTRRAVVREVLSYLGSPYGFGGANGGIDCSRLLLDVLGRFGVKFPRFSGWQAEAGTFYLPVAGLQDQAKQTIIDQAAKSGIVILHVPGHIMLYLGRDANNVPMVVHALSYYLKACENGGSTTMVVGKVQIGTLELGRGTEKTALLSRITKVTVLGKAPIEPLRAMAVLRPAAAVSRPTLRECRVLGGSRIFVTPTRRSIGTRVRAIATSRRDLGPATISFYSPEGVVQESMVTMTDGPPRGYIAQTETSEPGTWMAVLGDGDDRYGCKRFKVSGRGLQRERTAGKMVSVSDDDVDERPIWTIKRSWNSAYEDLFATFCERLFDYPVEDDRTWPDLHTLLRDADRNLLYNHFGQNEEHDISLKPDCADLPYALRTYFSWKLQLPFAIHECNRARDGRPPTCEVAEGNLMARSNFDGGDDASVFADFVNKHVHRKVHSSSGRTAPKTELSDFYPVALTRESLRPGTLFVDPYGHLLVVVDWLAQGAGGYGTLIGADAQPDGTIGRRRFWQGSFLFRPDTRSGGAGFKAFRPWRFEKSVGALTARSNRELGRRQNVSYSLEQYRGTESDFYDAMESIINPRALNPVDKMRSLIDALEEQVLRRGISVVTGEEYMKSQGFAVIDMPEGAKIFLTRGPWEDFATPSRDWRLLGAIHTVVEFPASVRRSPEQYGVDVEKLEDRVSDLETLLANELSNRHFSYLRSDGSSWQLSLGDLVNRRKLFEMSYNPNDCPERRWAAPKESEESKTCTRDAPPEQRLRMEEYRTWFAERTRPAL